MQAEEKQHLKAGSDLSDLDVQLKRIHMSTFMCFLEVHGAAMLKNVFISKFFVYKPDHFTNCKPRPFAVVEFGTRVGVFGDDAKIRMPPLLDNTADASALDKVLVKGGGSGTISAASTERHRLEGSESSVPSDRELMLTFVDDLITASAPNDFIARQYAAFALAIATHVIFQRPQAQGSKEVIAEIYPKEIHALRSAYLACDRVTQCAAKLRGIPLAGKIDDPRLSADIQNIVDAGALRNKGKTELTKSVRDFKAVVKVNVLAAAAAAGGGGSE